MSSIEINAPFTMPRDKLRAELGKLAEQLGEELQLDCEWQSDDCLNFARSGIQGEINIGDEEIDLNISLGLMLVLFKGKIEQEILGFIDEHIY